MNKEDNILSNLRYDLPASIVVFFVALPLCLGIALASGAPLFSGVVAGIIGGVVVGMLSGSQLGVSGPAAGLAVIVLSAITKLGSFEAFLLAVVFAGLIQIAFGLLKAGDRAEQPHLLGVLQLRLEPDHVPQGAELVVLPELDHRVRPAAVGMLGRRPVRVVEPDPKLLN